MNKREVAVVTGATTGIGRAVVYELAKQGYDIAAFHHRPKTAYKGLAHTEKIVSGYGSRVVFVQCDVTKERSILRALDKVKKMYGRIDVLVNNAGILVSQPFQRLTIRNLRGHLETNLVGAVSMTRHALPLLQKSKGARVIFISSASAIEYTPKSQCFSYAVSKCALIGVTRGLASELAPRMRINCVVPAYIETDILTKGISKRELEIKKNRTRLKRFGTVEEIGKLIAYLVSPAASYITGQTVHINGGRYFA